jgi:hypothetical protein
MIDLDVAPRLAQFEHALAQRVGVHRVMPEVLRCGCLQLPIGNRDLPGAEGAHHLALDEIEALQQPSGVVDAALRLRKSGVDIGCDAIVGFYGGLQG